MKEIKIKFDETSNYDEVIKILDLVRGTLLLQKQVDSQRLALAHLKLHLDGKCSAYQEVDTQNSKKWNELTFDFHRYVEDCELEQLYQTEKADCGILPEPILLDFEHFAHGQDAR